MNTLYFNKKNLMVKFVLVFLGLNCANYYYRFLPTSALLSSLLILAFISFFIITHKNRSLVAAITAQQKSMKHLREVENNFKRIFHSSRDAVLIIAGDTFVDCNVKVVKMLGAKNKEQVIHTHPAELSPLKQPDGSDSKIKAEAMIEIAINNGTHRFEWQHKKTNGTLFPVMVTLTVITVQGKEQLHVLWQDITSQRQHEEDLLEIAEKAKSVSLAKDTFLANMSHEIRTPMNGVIGMARLLQKMKLNDKADDLIGKLIYSAENLMGLLNDILDFSKIEAGQLSLENRSFCLETMMDNVISTLGFLADEKGLTLEDNSDYSNIPAWIKGDDMRLKQILTNLIGNAIKFTERGGVTITVKADCSREKIVLLLFTVADTGIGIGKTEQQDIFASFTQAESSISRKFGGTGLGLSISKQLVEMMGGEIGCTSVIGEGTVFSFSVIAEPGIAVSSTSQRESSSKCKNLRILLAEDNLINQQIATTILEEDSHTVKVADNGLEALRLLTKYEFDLVIMDVQMPKLDGLLTTTIIRKCEEMQGSNAAMKNDLEQQLWHRLHGKHTPILAMTANAMSGDKEKCLDAGMDHYLTKPFMPEDLHIAINMLNLPMDGDHAGTVSIATTIACEADNNYLKKTTDYLKNRYGLDEATIAKLLTEAWDNIDILQQELTVAFSKDDKNLLCETSQRLKGLFLNIGLDEFAKEGNRIDQQEIIAFQQEIVDKLLPPNEKLYSILTTEDSP